MAGVSLQSRSLTRGFGLLEGYLARRRARMADRLIPDARRGGRVLDVGCGCEPYFLTRTEFAAKIGLDKVVGAAGRGEHPSIRLMHFDIDRSSRLPFPDESFDAVTMLAVFEHVRVDRLVVLVDEIDRVLKEGGVFIMTTPAGWTGPILTVMKWLRLVSAVEIDDHEDAYTRARIRSILDRTRLGAHQARFGTFELLMNTWVAVTKGRRVALREAA